MSAQARAAAPAAGDAPLIRLSGIHKVYGRGEIAVHALRAIDLTVERGEFVMLMGASGSGKSTALNLLGCLDVPTAGHYWFSGVDTGRLSRDQRALLRRHYIGFVFQGFNLLPRTTALENVELPLVYRGGVRFWERRRRARRALADVGVLDRQHHKPNELSGGQQQRVAIARALVTQPMLLLADEPTGNLDTARSHELMRLLRQLQQQRHLSIVMVTHEADMAAYGDRVVHFEDGRVVSDGPPPGGVAP